MRKKFSKYIGFTFIFIAIFIVIGTIWLFTSFGKLTLEQCLSVIIAPQTGADTSAYFNFIYQALIPIIVLAIVFHLPIWKHERFIENTQKLKYHNQISKVVLFIRRNYVRVASFLLTLAIAFGLQQYEVIAFVKTQLQVSTFIEENYVDPAKVNLTFPDEQRNLIMIYLESTESTYGSVAEGGALQESLIPNLNSLAANNISFSSSEKLTGAAAIKGTTWTIAALTAYTSGLPTKLVLEESADDEYDAFMPGAYTIGDILEAQGYNQMFMCGSDADFGSRRQYFTEHGNYQIWDYNIAIEEGKIDEDYHVWWGFEDSKLYEYAKEQLTYLASLNEPFNFNLLTVDTHFPDGYLDENAGDEYDEQYANVIKFSDQQLGEFMSWIKEQSFYDNTTIVIVGDHLSMDQTFFTNNVDEFYDRTIYNAIINSAVSTSNIKNRIFSTMDYYPTILASLGIEIDGDRLGLGTNLFSNTGTLLEKYSIEYVNEEISKKSVFYNEELFR